MGWKIKALFILTIVAWMFVGYMAGTIVATNKAAKTTVYKVDKVGNIRIR